MTGNLIFLLSSVRPFNRIRESSEYVRSSIRGKRKAPLVTGNEGAFCVINQDHEEKLVLGFPVFELPKD